MSLGGEQVDLVTENVVGEYGAGNEGQAVGGAEKAAESQDILGQEVHGALDAAEVLDPAAVLDRIILYPLDGAGQSTGQGGLAHSMGIRQHHVTAGDLRGDNVFQLAGVHVDDGLDVVDQARDTASHLLG